MGFGRATCVASRLHGTPSVQVPSMRPTTPVRGMALGSRCHRTLLQCRAVPLPDDAKQAGASAVASARRVLAERLAELIRRDPQVAANAVEVGIIDQDWL